MMIGEFLARQQAIACLPLPATAGLFHPQRRYTRQSKFLLSLPMRLDPVMVINSDAGPSPEFSTESAAGGDAAARRRHCGARAVAKLRATTQLVALFRPVGDWLCSSKPSR